MASTPGCSTRTNRFLVVAQVGLEPTASLVLSESGLPLPTEPCRSVPRAGVEPATARRKRSTRCPSRAALPIGVPRRVVPDGIEPSFPGCRPGVVAAGPRDCFHFSSKLRGLESNQGTDRPRMAGWSSWFRARRHYQQQLPRNVFRSAQLNAPRLREMESIHHYLVQSQAACR